MAFSFTRTEPTQFLLVGHVKVYSNNPHIEDDLKKGIQGVASSISRVEI
jgi:hypothetical protein